MSDRQRVWRGKDVAERDKRKKKDTGDRRLAKLQENYTYM